MRSFEDFFWAEIKYIFKGIFIFPEINFLKILYIKAVDFSDPNFGLKFSLLGQ